MAINRRNLLVGAAAMAAAMQGGVAQAAVSAADAKALIEETIKDILTFLNNPAPATTRVTELRGIMERRSNLPLIAKYCAGRSWRDMSDSQQQRYVDAFKHYISVTYARRFEEYSDSPKIVVGRAIDAGRKGMLVESPIVLGSGSRFAVEWLVTDRTGKIEVVDIVIEGISLAATQREEIGAMIDRRGGDVEQLINHLLEAN